MIECDNNYAYNQPAVTIMFISAAPNSLENNASGEGAVATKLLAHVLWFF
jgi:hypothetical protein